MMTSRNKKNDEIQSCWFFFGGHKSDRKMSLMFVNINYWINLAVDYRDMCICVVLYGQDLGFFLNFFQFVRLIYVVFMYFTLNLLISSLIHLSGFKILFPTQQNFENWWSGLVIKIRLKASD